MSFSKSRDAQKGDIFLSLSRGETYVIREIIRIILTVHLWRANALQHVEEVVNCRIDHYQTPSTVYVSVFAKQADKDRSTIKIGENEVMDYPTIRLSSNIKLTCADSL
jgi:hypothetical protein